MSKIAFKIDMEEKFPHLANPPIVEAVIHWQARAQVPLVPETLRINLLKSFPEFPKCEPIQQFETEMLALVSDQDMPPKVEHQTRGGWHGFRLTSEDNRKVIQFKRDGLVFSNIRSYTNWDQFVGEAIKAWTIFRDVASPVQIQRLGVRFINQIPEATPESLSDTLRDPPTCPSKLPLQDFVYQSKFIVPMHPFGIRVIKVMQPTTSEIPQSSGLFIDCDVYTTKPLDCDESSMNDSLVKMRWLKNKIFFSLLTDNAIQSFKPVNQ